MAKLLFFAGSIRTESVNKKLAHSAYEYAKSKGMDATYIDLSDYEMPIYDGDLEAASGLPEKAIAFKTMLQEHDGVFIASPEYNSSFSPLLKNVLDWASRPHEENEASLSAYDGKVIALGAASPGGFGGMRGLVPLRMMLGNIRTIVLPEQIAVSDAYNAFDDNGKLKDDGMRGMLEGIVDRLNDVASTLNV